MRNRLAWVALFAIVACKGKEDATAEPARAAAAESAAAQVASAFAQATEALAKAQAAASGGVAVGGAPASVAPASPSAVAAVPEGFSAALSNELGRLGFSTAASDLLALGKDRGVLLNGLGRLAGHSSALSAIFNSDKVVSAFMKRPDMQLACRDPEKLKPLLLYVLSSNAARLWVNEPESIRAFTGSKLGVQLQACPAFKSLAQQPQTLATIAKSSPAAAAVIGNPNLRAELDRLKIRQDVTVQRFSRKPLR